MMTVSSGSEKRYLSVCKNKKMTKIYFKKNILTKNVKFNLVFIKNKTWRRCIDW